MEVTSLVRRSVDQCQVKFHYFGAAESQNDNFAVKKKETKLSEIQYVLTTVMA